MRRMVSRLLVVGLLSLTAQALAQEPAAPPAEPPKGPAEIFQRANVGRDARDMKGATDTGDTAAQATEKAPATAAPSPAAPADQAATAQPGAPAPSGDANTQAPAPGVPPGAPSNDDVHRALSDAQQGPSASEAPDLPTGAIDIEVLAPTGQPYGGAEIVLGIMASQGGRSEKRGTADAKGHYSFRDLPVGSKQAYRVNVLFGGAKFSSNPFRMPEKGGYRVRVPLMGTTQSDRLIFQVVGQTVVELKDDRLHITQQARLANAANEVFVFPKDGLLVPLPEGFTAFQWQDQMSDQQGVEDPDGKGLRLRGSLPPGAVTLAWAFDLEREGSHAKIPIQVPFRTYTYRVIAEAPPGLELKVTDFPEPEKVKDQGRDLLFTQIRRTAREAELTSIVIKLEGIPAPGPGRWVALALAILAAGVGLWRAFSGGESGEARRSVVEARKQHLLESARRVESEFARGEIGPEFHARRMDELTTELAMVLRDEENLAPAR